MRTELTELFESGYLYSEDDIHYHLKKDAPEKYQKMMEFFDEKGIDKKPVH